MAELSSPAAVVEIATAAAWVRKCPSPWVRSPVWDGFRMLVTRFSLGKQLLQGDCLHKLELHFRSRVNHRCAGGMSILRLSRCLWRACRLDAARLYRDPTSIHINRGEFHSERPGFARISARGRDLSECFGSSSQYDVSLNRNILRDLRLEASAYHTLRSDKANRRYCQRCSSGNCSRI